MALTDNLVAYWKLDESSGNATDASWNWHTGIAVNQATFAAWKIGNAGSFDGNADYFRCDDSTDFDFGTGAVSVSFWCYQDSLVNYKYIVNQRYNNWNTGAQFWIFTSPWGATGDVMTFYFYNGSASQFLYSDNGSHAATTREHWVMTRSSDWATCVIYKNWAENNRATWMTVRNADNNWYFSIGENIWQPWWWNGKIDEIWVRKRELTSDEVSTLYNSWNWLQYPFSTTSIKTIDWLAKASIKTVDALAIASVKTFNGLS